MLNRFGTQLRSYAIRSLFSEGHIIPTEPDAYMCGTVQTSSCLVQKHKNITDQIKCLNFTVISKICTEITIDAYILWQTKRKICK